MPTHRGNSKSDGDAHVASIYEDVEHVQALTSSLSSQTVDMEDIVPPDIARPLIVSSAAPVIPVTLALGRDATDARAYTFAIFGCILMATSVVHWRAPKWNSVWRLLDCFAVATCTTYGSWVSTTVPERFGWFWWVGMPIVTLIFVVNECAFYFELRNVPNVDECVDAKAYTTRRRVYTRTVRTHFFGVHLLSSFVASFVAYGIGSDGNQK